MDGGGFRDRGIDYMQQVHNDTQAFALALLRENERLRRQNAELQHRTEDLQKLFENQEGALAGVPARDSLIQRLAVVEKENHRLCAQYEELQQQSSNLLNLYVATYQLHGTLERGTVLKSIQEIVANMVGSEEIGIFEFDYDLSMLSLIESTGIDTELYSMIPLSAGAIGHAARTGEIYLGGTALDCPDRDTHVTACVPLKVDSQVTGVIAIFRLLGQKVGLDSNDIELFNLLKTHAGVALYCADLHAAMEVRRS